MTSKYLFVCTVYLISLTRPSQEPAMNGISGFLEARPTTSRSAYCFLHERQHQFGTGSLHHFHAPLAALSVDARPAVRGEGLAGMPPGASLGGEPALLSLRQIAPAGFLTQAFAVDVSTSCQS